ncbi:hypothetical protein niasHT_039986 [Heterodera trifolii]|uniref:dual-specificity kinase n=1 Tax=Heterodera trifolii TaxID=157864 RepID=A0ABD2J278_9BILA
MIFACAAAAIDTMLTPITTSKSATTVRECSSTTSTSASRTTNVGTPLRRNKRRSSGISSIEDRHVQCKNGGSIPVYRTPLKARASSTPKSPHPSTSKVLVQRRNNNNNKATASYSCSDLSFDSMPPSSESSRPSISQHSNGAMPSSPVSSTTASKRRVSASRGAFSGTLKAMDDFELLEVLAQGFFGTVYKVREKANRTAEPIVMKVPIMRDNQQQANNGTPKRDKKVADWEVYMLNELATHPNILKSKGLCVDQTSGHWQLNLLVEFCDRGTLQQAIIGGGAVCVVDIDPPLALAPAAPAMPWLHIAHISRDISDAMAFMHGKGFFHRDLTSMNVLLKSQPSTMLPMAVVADFGLATRIPDNLDTKLQQVGTADWKAPEVLSEQYYDEKSDLFSFGIILCQMIAATDADPDKGVFRTKSFGIDFAKFEQKCPTDVPIDLLKCAKMCCRFRPDKRPSFGALLDRFCAQIIPCLALAMALDNNNDHHHHDKDKSALALDLDDNDGNAMGGIINQ